MHNIGTTMRNARVKLGKSLDVMAKEIGTNKSTLSRIENGRIFPTFRIPEVAKAYGLAVEAFPDRPERGPNSHPTEPSISFEENITDIIEATATLKLPTFSVNDLLFLVGIRKQVGTKLSAALINELLTHHKQA